MSLVKRDPVAETAFGAPTAEGKKGASASGKTKTLNFNSSPPDYPDTVELEPSSMYRFHCNQDCHFALMSGQDETAAPEYVDATDMYLLSDSPEYFSTDESNYFAGAIPVTTSGQLFCTKIESIKEWIDR
jgi:hypothetical protein